MSVYIICFLFFFLIFFISTSQKLLQASFMPILLAPYLFEGNSSNGAGVDQYNWLFLDNWVYLGFCPMHILNAQQVESLHSSVLKRSYLLLWEAFFFFFFLPVKKEIRTNDFRFIKHSLSCLSYLLGMWDCGRNFFPTCVCRVTFSTFKN